MSLFPGSHSPYGFYLPIDPQPKPQTGPEPELIKVECPMCRGRGVTAEAVYEKVFDPIATGALGQFAQPQFTDSIAGYEDKKCQLCYGRTYIHAKPV